MHYYPNIFTYLFEHSEYTDGVFVLTGLSLQEIVKH